MLDLLFMKIANIAQKFFLDECLHKLAKNNNYKVFFDSLIMLRFGETKVGKEEFFGAKKLKLIEAMSNSKYLIECLDEVIKPLILILPKIIGYIKTFIEKK